MNQDRKLIAEALLEIALERSETTFIDIAEDNELIEAAKKIGISLPSPDLLVMKTVYCEIDKVNKNGVILSREDVEKGLHTIIGKNCNWEHQGAGRICGYTISANINGDKVETINVIFKSLFPEQIEELKEKIKTKEAAVSFEIWNRNKEGQSVVHDLDNGQRSISPILFHGTGILLSHKPACPRAKIFKLVAENPSNYIKDIKEKVFAEDLIFAEMAVEASECKNCENCEEEDKQVNDLEKKTNSSEETKTNEALVETKKDEEISEVKSENKEETPKVEDKPKENSSEIVETETKEEKAIETPEEENKVKETKIEEKSSIEETPEVKEEKISEPSEEASKEKVEVEPEKAQPEDVKESEVKVSKVTTEETVTTIEIPTVEGFKYEQKGKRTRTTEFSDGTKDVRTEDFEVKNEQKYGIAELEAKIKEATKGLEEKVEAKDKELEILKSELEKKNIEIEKLTPKVEEAAEQEEIELEVGSVEFANKYKSIKDEVNAKAFPKRK